MPKFDLSKARSQQYENVSYTGSDHYLWNEGEATGPKRRTRYIVIAVVLLVIVAVAVGLGVGLNKKSADKNTSGQQDFQQGTGNKSTMATTLSAVKTTTATAPSLTKTTTTATTSSLTTKPTTPTVITRPPTSPVITTGPPTSPVITTTTEARTAQSSTTTKQTTTSAQVDWLSEPCVDQEASPTCPWSENPLLVVSLDGFRAEYLLRNLTPVIQKLRTCGVHTPYMRSVYPTLTFPNHYSIVTGLYPESHGIVGNSMYDPKINASFRLGSHESLNPAWWGGEPLWTTAKRQGKKTAAYFWVGSDVNISGSQPDIWKKYNGSIPYEERVKTVLDWLSLPEADRPDFITLYFDEPDHQGHGTGPDSPEVNDMLGKVDTIIRRLMDGLLRKQLDHCVNIIILADHGMADTSCERQVALSPYIHYVDDLLIFAGTTGHINPRYRKVHGTVYENEHVVSEDEIVASLECKNSHLGVFTRETIPVRHHYSNNDRIGDVVMDIEDSWLVYPKTSHSCLKGNHGYDNIYKSMHALFLAHGPNFKQNMETGPFENIELYNLMSELLNITPSPNNGTAGSLHHLLREAPSMAEYNDTATYPECGNVGGTRNKNECTCNDTTVFTPPMESAPTLFPFGKPTVSADIDHCMLSGHQFASIFSYDYHMPIMSTFLLTSNQVKAYNETKRDELCIVPDPRLSDENDPMCSEFENTDKNIELAYVFSPGFASTDIDTKEAMLSSNKVPMYTGFREGIWKYLWRVTREYASIYGDIHVTTGPVFDYNFDSLRDSATNTTVYVSNTSSVPLPTHFYMILTKCSNQSSDMSQCSADNIDTLSFVLPHQNHTHNCMPDKRFLQNNVVRVRDIEHLTSLRFLSRFERSTGARLRTFLPLEMWPSPLLTPWEELPCPLTENATCPEGTLPLLLISLDGFRAEYLERELTPTIRRLSQCGVHTPFMRSVYPTVTFPNHYTIVTGLYPESHGIIANSMYDEEIDKLFSLSAATAKDPRWWKGEPIWTTAQKQGLKTATYFWPGSDVNISGLYPDIWKPYDGQAGYSQRVYDVLDWLTMPKDTRPDFITLYFDEPDHAGHAEGPESDAVNGQLETVDELINILMTNLYEKNLHSCVNMIIVADHGMSDQTCEKTVVMKDYYPDITNMLMFERVLGQVFPQFQKDNRTDAHRQNESYSIDEFVANTTCKHSAMKVFTKETLPIRHHYTNSERIGDLLLDMEDEWLVFSKRATYCEGGNHGWDNTYKNMHALFLAHGPAFKENFTVEPFENIELYNLMSEILGIEPANNNGTVGSLHYILRNPKSLSNESKQSGYNACLPMEDKPVPAICGCNRTLYPSAIYMTNGDAVLPFGLPHYTENDSVCILHQNGSSTAFSKMFRSLVWTTAIASNLTLTTATDDETNACIVEDTRVSNWTVTQCQSTANVSDVVFTPLPSFGSYVDTEVAYLSSSLVPLYTGFKEGIWAFLQELIADYSSLYGKLSVTMGTVFDYNHDGLWEGVTNKTIFTDTTPIPSHVFIIVIKCTTVGEELPCDGNVDILSFVIPHLRTIPNCLKNDVYLKDNVARLRDIELLTGLQFMTSFNISTAARLRTYLPEALWKSNLIKDWSELTCPQQDQCQSTYRPLLVISLDGFRADYLLRNITPTISRLSQCGVHAPYMRSVYPTKTFPNHYTIATGLYPESHGIIDNNMFDRDIGKRFYLGSETSRDARWWGGDPIWLTAKKQGLKTATYFWPGSDVKIQDMYPDIWKAYDGSVSYSGRVDEVLSWMSLSEDKRPDFITLYFDQPDLAGHKYGPSNDKDIGAALDKVDESIAQLMNGLLDKKLHNCVNLVIIADHGMADVSCKQIVRLRDYVDYDYLSRYTYVWEGAFGRIANTYIYNSTIKDISSADHPASTDGLFTNLTCATPHMNVYSKTSLPERHHYSNNERIDDIILDMESGWLVTRSYIKTCKGGNHGYDNIDKSMEALFLAYGPAFKWNVTVDPFENIELYNMFTDVLNITASPNNGTVGSLNHILQNPRTNQKLTGTTSYRNASIVFANAEDYIAYVRSWKCFNDCTSVTNDTISEMYTTLSNVPNPVMNDYHAPVGIPLMLATTAIGLDRNVTLLHQPGYITGYDENLQSPLWLSQTVNVTQTRNTGINCVVPDPRVRQELHDAAGYCLSDADLQWLSLSWNEVLGGDATASLQYLSTRFAKMEKSFVQNIWIPLQELVRDWVLTYKQLHIITGSVFDYNHDGLPDKLNTIRNDSLASHFYVIITRCLDSNVSLEACQEYTPVSYILPQRANITLCKTFQDFLIEHEARVRDVELITGLEFFTTLPYDTAVRLRTLLPQGLWTHD